MAQLEVKFNESPLFVRIISGAVLAPLVLAIVYVGTPIFEALISLAAIIMAFEWKKLCNGRIIWLFVGVFYIGIPCLVLISLRLDPLSGQETIFWLLSVVWAADTGAYAFGSLIGGWKLASIISPNKTWSGLIGGILFSAFIGVSVASALNLEASIFLFGLSAFVGTFSQLGDLVESWFKRYFGVKDTGSIIPGHGGLLDRVDGLLVASVFVAIINSLSEDGIFKLI